MTTLYAGFGLPNIVNIGTDFISTYSLGRQQKLTLNSSEIENLCLNNTYVTRVETSSGNNALSLQFSKNTGNNHMVLRILSDNFARNIPSTSSLTIRYIPTVNAAGTGTDLTLQFIGDTFNLERTFPLNLTFDTRALDPDHALYDLTTIEKISIKKIFDAFKVVGFDDKYILCKGSLLYLVRGNKHQSNSINISINNADISSLNLVAENLIKNGFLFQFITRANSGELSTLKMSDGNARIVVKVCHEEDINNYHFYGHQNGQEAKFLLPKTYLDIKKLITLGQISISVPNDHVGYLTENYGESYMTPNPDFDRWNGNPLFVSSSIYSGINLDSTKATVNDIIV